MRNVKACVAVILLIDLLGLPNTALAKQAYSVNVTRIGQDFYRETLTGLTIQTRYCYEYVYYEDAVLFYEPYSNRLIFSGGSTCEVASVLRTPGRSSGSLGALPTASPDGYVVDSRFYCDYFIVEDRTGDYALLEWFGGALPEDGDALVGEFQSYGFKTLYNVSQQQEVRVWVEDYWLSQREAVRQYLQNC